MERSRPGSLPPTTPEDRSEGPTAVVIPFGVPDGDAQGLGLGLAALLHGHARIDGRTIGLAQLHAKPREDESSLVTSASSQGPSAVESLVPPKLWREMGAGLEPPPTLTTVITGAFEPPTDGRGMLMLLAFDARGGSTQARVEVAVDDERAGETLVAAFEELAGPLHGELGRLKEVRSLSWEVLESVLRAERCALHDPFRGGLHDPMAALVHLGRAVEAAPEANYPASRLATVALEAAFSRPGNLADAAVRALTAACGDAPGQMDLPDALALLLVRTGRTDEGERQALAVLDRDPVRARTYVTLSEARRSKGDLDGALQAVEAGLAKLPAEPLLCVEWGVVLAERGELDQATVAWREVLLREPLHAAAFTHSADVALARHDALAAQVLVDAVLAAPTDTAHPEVIRRALRLVLATEPEGLPRAVRLGSLASQLLHRVPEDPWGLLFRAQACAQQGQTEDATSLLEQVLRAAPVSLAATEAARGLFQLRAPETSREVDGVLRAAMHGGDRDLPMVAARARHLAAAHGVWQAHLALALAERRLGNLPAAKAALRTTLEAAPGCSPAHLELVAVYRALGDTVAALHHARRGVELDGPSPDGLTLVARCALEAGQLEDASLALRHALTLEPRHPDALALRADVEGARSSRPPPKTGVLAQVRGWFRR